MNSNSQSDRNQGVRGVPLLKRAAPFVLILVVHFFLIGPMAIGSRAPGFRDSAYMYYPLFDWIDQQTVEEGLPFWNPYDRFGTPVIEDATTSVFYPGKVVFLFRSLSYTSRFGIYVLLHTLLAAFGAYWCARILRCGRAGSTLAAIAYSLSGSFLFQVCNIVFLVSAAWLPWSLGCWWLLMRRGRKGMIAGTAVCLAMMVLGGDPQMAYHSALIGASLWAAGIVKSLRRHSISLAIRQSFAPTACYVAVGGLAIGLSAIQILPTASYSKYSERNRVEGQLPRSIYEASSFLVEDHEQATLANAAAGLMNLPEPESHHRDTYEFSLPPWAATELIWPNYTGRLMPKFQRWTVPFPMSQKLWSPSIFLGVIPFALALASFRLRGPNRVQVWLTWLTLFFAFGSLGSFGLIWFLRTGASQFLGWEIFANEHGGVGGVYWWMVTFLPKYIVFRYPAKLFVVASLGFSLLAARQLKGRKLLTSTWLPRILTAILTLTIFGMVYVLLPKFGFFEMISRIGAHETYGPFDVSGCMHDIKAGLLSTLLVTSFLLLSLYLTKKQKARIGQLLVAIVAIASAELLYSNSWLVLTVDAKVFEQELPKREMLVAALNESGGPNAPLKRVSRFPRTQNFPYHWQEESSSERLDEITWWQRQTLYPKFHLTDRIAMIDSFSSIEIAHDSIDYLSPNPVRHSGEGFVEKNLAQDLMLAGFVQFPTKGFPPAIVDSESNRPLDFQEIDTIASNSTRIIAYPDLPISMFHSAISSAKIELTKFSSNEMHVTVSEWPMEILVRQAWAPGWNLEWEIDGKPMPAQEIEILPFDESSMILRFSPAATEHFKGSKPANLRLYYLPRHFNLGLWTSVVAWHIVLAFSLMFVFGRIRLSKTYFAASKI